MSTVTSHSLPSDWRKFLDIDPVILPRKFPPSTPLLERVLLRSFVDDAGCWLYQGSLDAGGYSCLRIDGGNERGHRVTWEALNGPVPQGLHLDHLCRVRNCVNVFHLEAVTPYENSVVRAIRKNGLPVRTHCPRGHEATPENSYYRPDGKGRNCLTCIRMRTDAVEKIRKAEAQARRDARQPRPHGDPVKYSYEGCRCSECRAAATARGRENRAKRRKARDSADVG